MNKRYQKLIIIIMAAVFAVLLVSCSQASDIAFGQEEYIIYLDEAPEFAPSVFARPKGSSYTLTSSNTAVLEVLEDGKTLRAVYPDAKATITATSGGKSATARVIIYKERKVITPPVPKETFTVFFNTLGRGGIAAQEVLPGGKAVRPEGYMYEDNIIVGWFTDKEYLDEYDFSAPVINDLILYACWESGEATFQFVTRSDGVYIRGLRYINVEYGDIIIPGDDGAGNPVVGIDEKAFYRSATGSKANIIKFKSAVIPASVKVIGKEAFTGISTLTAIYFDGESNLTSIGDSAFQNCSALEQFILPDSLTSLGASAFSGNSKLNIKKLPAGLKVISTNAFNGTATVSVDLKNVTEIKEQAFYGARVGTILNSESLVQLGKNAFLNTPWWQAKRQANSGADKPIYLHDNILVAYYTSVQTKAFDIKISESARLIADSAFQNVTRGIIRFATVTPPEFGSYVFNAESVIVVPEAERGAYGDKLTAFKYKLYSEYTILTHLEVLINSYTAAAPQTVNVIINKYKSNTVPAEYANRLDIKAALYEMFTERKASINIQKIKTSAFFDISNLATVVLPPRVYLIETNAFNKLSVFGQLRIEGEYGDSYTPSRATIENSAINPILSSERDYFISVPSGKLTQYRTSGSSSWGRYALKIEGYNP